MYRYCPADIAEELSESGSLTITEGKGFIKSLSRRLKVFFDWDIQQINLKPCSLTSCPLN